MAKDNCIICGNETPYEFETHIDYRIGYIEGAGQLCSSCYMKGSPEGRETICVPKHVIWETPNDMELGRKIRSYSNFGI